ncbi:MAG: alpha/beta family hydrolase [Candidatus Limnocylindria bacterium]
MAGGRSYGGRVASLAASQAGYGGLVLISYPLHPPGRPEAATQRTAHWPQIRCPVLVLAGDADPFARAPLLRDAVKRLPTAELVMYPGGRHGLMAELDDLACRISDFVADVSRR